MPDFTTERRRIAQCVKRARVFVFLVTALWQIIHLTFPVVYAENRGLPVVIVLRELVQLPIRRVLLADIADIHGGPEPLRQQIARLELEDAAQAGQQVQITVRRVIYRLRLAGIEPDVVRIEGAQSVRVTFVDTPQSTVTSDGSRSLALVNELGEVPCYANVPTDYRIRRANNPNVIHAEAASLPKDNLSPQSGRRELQRTSDPVLVKKGDFLRLIALVGPLEISTRGEALADGKRGQVIPVRNVDSKQVVHARIIRPATAQVDY